MREVPRTAPVRFAHGADALEIAKCRRFKVGNFCWIEAKRSQSALQKIRRFRPLPGQRAQFRNRQAYVSRHALDFRFGAASEIRFRAPLQPSSAPREQGLKWRLALSSLG
jgi:hypothetical protein